MAVDTEAGRGYEYPENKKLVVLKEQANYIYADICAVIKEAETAHETAAKAHREFFALSKSYVAKIKEIEGEAVQPLV